MIDVGGASPGQAVLGSIRKEAGQAMGGSQPAAPLHDLCFWVHACGGLKEKCPHREWYYYEECSVVEGGVSLG